MCIHVGIKRVLEDVTSPNEKQIKCLAKDKGKIDEIKLSELV